MGGWSVFGVPRRELSLNFGIYNNVRILDSATVAYMLSDQLGYPAVMQPPWLIYTQGLSWWQVFPINNSAWARGGSWNGILAYVSFDQEEKWVTIFFQNQRPLNTIVGRMGEINYPFTKYADLYGNIYAFRPEVDKGYARVGIDRRTNEQLKGRTKLITGIYAIVEVVSEATFRDSMPDKYWLDYYFFCKE